MSEVVACLLAVLVDALAVLAIRCLGASNQASSLPRIGRHVDSEHDHDIPLWLLRQHLVDRRNGKQVAGEGELDMAYIRAIEVVLWLADLRNGGEMQEVGIGESRSIEHRDRPSQAWREVAVKRSSA